MTTEPIDLKLAKSIETLSKEFASCKQVKAYESSVEEFDKLIKQGVAHKRGNNLLSVADAHLKSTNTNTAHNESITPTRERVRFLDVDSTHCSARNW